MRPRYDLGGVVEDLQDFLAAVDEEERWRVRQQIEVWGRATSGIQGP